MWRALIVLVVVLSGCDSIFGLPPPVPPEPVDASVDSSQVTNAGDLGR